MGLLGRLRRAWHEFRKGTPGRRFQDHYCRKHDPHGGDGRRLGFIAGGIVLMVLGAAVSILPWMPGSVLVAMGALLVCAESRTAARGVDFVETRARSAVHRLRLAARRLQR